MNITPLCASCNVTVSFNSSYDENKLYFTPYIYLKSGNSKSIYKTVFMDSSMYVAFTKFNY